MTASTGERKCQFPKWSKGEVALETKGRKTSGWISSDIVRCECPGPSSFSQLLEMLPIVFSSSYRVLSQPDFLIIC